MMKRLFSAGTIKQSLVLGGVVCCVAVRSVWGFGTFTVGGDPSGFSDLINHVKDVPKWDISNMTYKFDSSFLATFPNPLIEDQVRLAIQTWQNAYNTDINLADYSYNRADGWQPFGDIRSVTLHEFGHVLGLQHPAQAAASNRNYASIIFGLVQVPAHGNEVLRSWINPGDYNHILSFDELQGYSFLYGRKLTFTKVPSNSPANIVLSSYHPGNPNNWANGGWSGNFRASDHYQGAQITSGGVSYNDASGVGMGLKTLGLHWDWNNPTGNAVTGITIRTTGTNNPNPLFHYDNNNA